MFLLDKHWECKNSGQESVRVVPDLEQSVHEFKEKCHQNKPALGESPTRKPRAVEGIPVGSVPGYEQAPPAGLSVPGELREPLRWSCRRVQIAAPCSSAGLNLDGRHPDFNIRPPSPGVA